jgi:hypothetical protein
MNKMLSLLTGFQLMVGIAGSSASLPLQTIARDITPISWDTTAAGFKGEEGRTYRFRCPSDDIAQTI